MKWHASRFEERPGVLKVSCVGCGTPMWLPPSKVKNNLHCTMECRRTAGARRRAGRTKQCESCGVPFVPRPRQLRLGQGKFCSQACNTTFREAGTDALIWRATGVRDRGPRA